MIVTETPPNINIKGSKVGLGPISRSDLPTITQWMNDLDTQIRIGRPTPGPVTLQEEESWYDKLQSPGSGVQFLIRELETGKPVGSAGLHAIDYRNRKTTFGIMIGDADVRGRGFGTEATVLILDYGFTVLGLHSMSLDVAEFNLAGQRAYAKAGFQECGRLREAIWFAGKMWDQISMDCLATEFTSPFFEKEYPPDERRT